MKKILLLGMSPLPTENEICTLGPGKRTWQFTKALLAEGHRVVLICSRHLAAYKSKNLMPIIAEEHDNLIYYSIEQSVFESVTWIQQIHDRFEPDCIVGATVFPTSIAVQLRTNLPIWGDLFGHLMAEAQTKSFVFNDDYYILKMWEFEERVLDRADAFSVVSTPRLMQPSGNLVQEVDLMHLREVMTLSPSFHVPSMNLPIFSIKKKNSDSEVIISSQMTL